MKSAIHILRFLPLVCILATFPVLGQVENATDTETEHVAAPVESRSSGEPARGGDPLGGAIRFPRLVASDARVDGLPDIMLAGPAERVAVAAPAARVAAVQAEPVELAEVAALPAVSAEQRIVALAAVPAVPAGAGGEAVTPADLAGWTEPLLAFLRASWREIGLVTALVVASGLLFWRLGERSRHVDQELVLDFEAGDGDAAGEETSVQEVPAAGEAVGEAETGTDADLGADAGSGLAARPVATADRDTAEPATVDGPPVDADADGDAPLIAAPAAMGDAGELLLDDPLAGPAPPPRRIYPTLHEAIAAMRADMAGTSRPPVDA